ncbi:MAG: hypothetical protein KAJ48_07955 [Elusimicrobiales bacterium]|nr:hypothetical protein [Elusimicrobiales bacterium]
MKKALGEYSKKKVFDDVQMNMIGHIAWIESYLWNAYSAYTLPRFLGHNPSFTKRPKQYAKMEIRKEFDQLMKRGYY